MKFTGILFTCNILNKVDIQVLEKNCKCNYPVNSIYCNICGTKILPKYKNTQVLEIVNIFDELTNNKYYKTNIYSDRFYLNYKHTNILLHRDEYITNKWCLKFDINYYKIQDMEIEDYYINMWNEIKEIKKYLINKFKEYKLEYEIKSGDNLQINK